MRETSPEDIGNFKTVIKRLKGRGKGITGRYKWIARRDFVEKYAELLQEKRKYIQRKKIINEQQKADRVRMKQELAQRYQEREMNARQGVVQQMQEQEINTEQNDVQKQQRQKTNTEQKVVHHKIEIPEPSTNLESHNNPLTEDEKIDLVLKTANEPTKEIMRALILELERKNKQFETAEERSQSQLMAQDAHIQELIAINNHLAQQLTTQQELYQEHTHTPEPEHEQESYTMEMPTPHHNPFVASTDHAEPTPASLAFYNQDQQPQQDPPPIPSPLEYSQQTTLQETHYLRVGLWIAFMAFITVVMLLILVVSDIIKI